MCLNLPKTIGKNSIVQLLVNNVSLSYGVYELMLKTSKVISVYEKESKGKCSNYRIIICNLVFQISYFASHALIFVTEEISEQLGSDNFCCWNIC